MRWIPVALLLPLSAACGGSSSSPAAPGPATPALRANIGIASITVSGETQAVGQAYRVTLHLRESAGTAATILAVDLAFTNGSTALVSTHDEQPMSGRSNVCPPSGSIDTKEFVVVDVDGSHAYATTVQAKVTFTDSSTAVATAVGSAGVPALPPAPPQTFTLTGVITDNDSRAAIAGASLSVLNGSNMGKTATTDSTGTYVMHDLVADTFRLRAAANAYDAGEQNVTVPTIPRADFILSKSCGYALTASSGTVSPGALFNSFALTRTAASDCSWTASPSDPWIVLFGPTTGSGAASIVFSVAGSGLTRTGSIVVNWSTGTARYSLTATASICSPPTTVTIPSSGGGALVNMGAGCVNATTKTIDVPWIHIGGTMGGGLLLEVSVDVNSGGAPRTGHITFTGDHLFTQITFEQS